MSHPKTQPDQSKALTPTNSVPLGFDAPTFTLPDTVSRTPKSSAEIMAGGPTVVHFMCNHCPFVVHILPEFVAFAHEYMARGINVVANSSNDVENYPMDSPELMTALATEMDFRLPYLCDDGQEMERAPYRTRC